MSRPQNSRKIFTPPKFKGFKPFGYLGKENSAIYLLMEEYESIRLSDYELLTQEEASKNMGISRPTFTRIYKRARRKIATAFAESRPIEIEGGKVHFDEMWYKCLLCGSIFNNPVKKKKTSCPICNASNIEIMNKA